MLIAQKNYYKFVDHKLCKDIENVVCKLSKYEDIVHLALMADVHLSHHVCVGTVLATKSTLFPKAIGGDLGCGMTSIAINADSDLLQNRDNAGIILQALQKKVPVAQHSKESIADSLPASLLKTKLSHASLEKEKHKTALYQFGTLGRGNHFLELQRDENHCLWATVHTGSRAMGQAIAKHHCKGIQQLASKQIQIEANSAAGQAYLNDCQWAYDYAHENRLAILQSLCQIMKKHFGAEALLNSTISCHHNFLRKEKHFDTHMWVHRKGALSAQKGELGIIPGSMGAPSFHVEGKGEVNSLSSSSHGAGRSMSRSMARQNIKLKDFRQQMSGIWFDINKEQKLIDESPKAYKNIHKVMKAQSKLTKTIRKLYPLLSYKGV